MLRWFAHPVGHPSQWSGIKLATVKLQVQRPNHLTTEPLCVDRDRRRASPTESNDGRVQRAREALRRSETQAHRPAAAREEGGTKSRSRGTTTGTVRPPISRLFSLSLVCLPLLYLMVVLEL